MLPLTRLLVTLGVVLDVGVHGRTIELNWTSNGVEPYRNHRYVCIHGANTRRLAQVPIHCPIDMHYICVI